MNNLEKNDEQQKEVLDPDHPMLKKFQEALKSYYLHQINRLKNDIFEYETETKKKNEEISQCGLEVYEAQQMVQRQQISLEELTKNLDSIKAAKEEVEHQLEEKKRLYKNTKEELIESEKWNLKMQNELNTVSLLINQVSKWEEKIESKLTINQRVIEKSHKDNLKLSEAKHYQDIRLYKLMCINWKLESEIESLNIQTKLKEEEKADLQKTIILGNTNMEALETECRCLMHSWNSVVVAIGARDRVVSYLQDEKSKMQNKIQEVICEIEKVKKLIKAEMNTNERHTMNKARIELDVSLSRQKMDEMLRKYDDYSTAVAHLLVVLEQTEKDTERAIAENNVRQCRLTAIMKENANISTQKTAIEKQLLEDLENRVTNDKVASNLCRVLSNTKEKKKQLEIVLNEAENKQSLLTSEIETHEFINEENNRLLLESENQLQVLNKEIDEIQSESKKYEIMFTKKERHVTFLNNKLQTIMAKHQLSTVVSPQDLRLATLAKQIDETQTEIKELQIFWLREQKSLLRVSEERQQQIHKLHILNKQILVLEQKNLKVSNDIENYRKQSEKIIRNINNLQNKASGLCDHLMKKRDKKFSLDKANFGLQSQYDGKLKDTELECLQLAAAVAEIEEEKLSLSKQLIVLHTEALEWEKKIKLTKEAKSKIRTEQSQGGDIENMKQEIQRMGVIYGQLKKAQDKLIKDLQHCVSRRDAIFTRSEANKCRGKVNEETTRITYLRKLDNIRNQIKRVTKDVEKCNKNLVELEDEKRKIEQKINLTKNDLKFFDNYSATLCKEIEIRKTGRQFKYEILIMMQKKLNVYNDLVAKKQPFFHTKRHLLNDELSKHTCQYDKLNRVLEGLLVQFPAYHNELTRMQNSLKVYDYVSLKYIEM